MDNQRYIEMKDRFYQILGFNYQIANQMRLRTYFLNNLIKYHRKIK